MNIKDLIDNIGKGDAQASNNTFNSIVLSKMNVALDARKEAIANAMYGSNEPINTEEPKADANI